MSGSLADAIASDVAPDAAIARLEHVRFSYDEGATWALDDVSLAIAPGEYVCLTGANGSGKSTLARLLCALSAPDGGVVTLLGRRVFDEHGAHADNYRMARRGIGAVFQNPEDQIVTTVVEDDVAFGPENLAVPRNDIGSHIADALRAVDLADMRAADPTRMSGGQQQRVAIAGMLAMRPRMLVLDEPTAMLDPEARAELLAVLDTLHARGTTIVHVTHHADETARASRVIRLESGRVAADGRACATDAAPTADDSSTGVACDDSTSVAGDYGEAADGRAESSARMGTDESGPAWRNPQNEPHQPPSGAARPEGETRPASDVEPAVRVEHVSFSFSGAANPALDDVSFEVRRGEVLAIMGRNGSGKSTLARLLCALDVPNRGDITVGGVRVAKGRASGASKRAPRKALRELRRQVGYVMQHPERQLFAETVADDVAYGPRNQGLSEREVAERVTQALSMLGAEYLADRDPFSLSGGQRRLVAIAGVLACRPRVLVLDEPTASLDERASAAIRRLVRELRAQGVTVLIVTHNADEARELADRVLVMRHGRVASLLAVDDVFTDEVELNDDGGRTDVASESGETSADSDRVAKRPSHEGSPRANLSRAPLAQVDPRVKMVAFLAMMFTAFAIATPAQLALCAAMTAGLIAAARLHPMRLLASVRAFLALFVVMGLLNVFFVRSGTPIAQFGPITITDEGVGIAVLYACRFALVIVMGAIFLETTTPTRMTDAFASLLSPLRRLGVHTQELSLVLSLALRFIPTLMQETMAVVDAQSARGGGVETGTPMRRIKALSAIIVPVFAGTLRHAGNLGLALDARCYEEGIRRTQWHAMRVSSRDIVFAALAVIYIAALLAVPTLALR
ncbi:energy-coupling factor transporter ATPase [Bifidobacterium eulemuris]|uniref:ATP-binding cassette domain-containing protein n=1 Tax=Bifidobacterium eulemuris TaxID=1765219 RepID=A0A261GBU2_9BIFI|nr:energy-coupling factor transporter ATPase [Bifidobacterium eulemuris]OZG68874.1 cobalt ABC transporter [Bifidobacterium eulemuris]QOL31583.1 ATP-binding cassette domain-containing protein [Bifidobacterium eulemuris]